jgi:DNA-binding GntR family transcriptional regulator
MNEDPSTTTSRGIAEPDRASASGAGPSPPLPQRVAGQLRDMIVQDALTPGQRIRERSLAAQLDVSRTPLREALKVLATEGLVELSPHRGALVANPNPAEIRDMLRVLGVLEGLAGELACSAATQEEIDEIQALHYEMLASFARKDRLAYFKANQKIHQAIVAASRNQSLIETHARLNARLYRVRFQSNLRNRTWPTAIEEHKAILDALARRDGAALSTLMRDHLGSTWAKVSAIIAEDGAAEGDAGR